MFCVPSSNQEIDMAFATLVDLKANALLVIPDPSFAGAD